MARAAREVPAEPGRAILNDAQVRRLAKAAIGIKHLFLQQHQDIEWAFRNDRLYIVQTRPYQGQD